MWLFIEPVAWFLPEISPFVKSHWLTFLLLGLVIGFIRAFPKMGISNKIKGKDIHIEIAVKDILKLPGSIIIGTNATFDTSLENDIISENSLQGKLTKRYFSSIGSLDRQIDESISDVPSTQLSSEEKSFGKLLKYPIGTVAKVQGSNRVIYLLAISNLNSSGVSITSLEDIKYSLLKLWGFCRDKGNFDSINISILGTGYSRLNETRETVIEEIVKSFIASCNEGKFSEKLTIAINPQDYINHRVDIEYLNRFLDYACTSASKDITVRDRRPAGTPIS